MGKAHIRVFQLFVKQPHCYCFPVNMNYVSVRVLFALSIIAHLSAEGIPGQLWTLLRVVVRMTYECP